MLIETPSTVERRGPWRRHRRWVAIGLVSLLIHLTAIDWLPRWHRDPPDPPVDESPLQARLMPAIPPDAAQPPPAPAPAPVPPAKSAQPRPAPRRPAQPPSVPGSARPVPPVAVAAPAADASPTAEPAPSVAAPPVEAEAAPAPLPPAPAATPPPPPPPPPVAIAPQSARLAYKVLYVDAKNAEPVRYYGVGSIDWSIADGRYRSELVAAVDFLLFKVDVLSSHSEGSVTPAGLAPDRYTESPRRRATVATNFNRDARQSISFSASTATAPLLSGAQDRLSVLFQIGALLLADTSGAAPQGRIEIPVAGVRGDVETWTFQSIGPEVLDIRGQPLSTTHLRRAPRPDSNDRTIDVWIAGDDGGYPARVLYTEPNGSTIEMTLDRIVAPG